MDKAQIVDFAVQNGAHSCGIAPLRVYNELLPLLERRGAVPFTKPDFTKRVNPFLYLKEGKSAIVCLYPYRDGGVEGVAKYARGGDYHPYVKGKLREICDYMGESYRYKLLVDSGGLCDKYLAYLAGLGFYGKNNLLYADGIGSRFYIGSILTDMELPPDKPLDKTCLQCNACINACIGGALGEDFTFDVTRCASYLTQTKEPLTEKQKKIVEQCGTKLGCDICADVCPLNKGLDL